MLKKFNEIVKAWISSYNPTPDQESQAAYRASICNECPHKKHLDKFNTYICSKCNCPLNKKIFSHLPNEEACPDSRW